MSLLHKNHLRYSLGDVTIFVQIGATVPRRLRSIQAQVVIKATLFLIAMYFRLEAINCYYMCADIDLFQNVQKPIPSCKPLTHSNTRATLWETLWQTFCLILWENCGDIYLLPQHLPIWAISFDPSKPRTTSQIYVADTKTSPQKLRRWGSQDITLRQKSLGTN